MSTNSAKTETWQEKYSSQIKTADEAVSLIKPGQRVFIGTGCGQPEVLIDAMVKNSDNLVDTEIIDFLSYGSVSYAAKELSDNFRINSFFIGDKVRESIKEGLGVYSPIFLSDLPALFSSGRLTLDIALIHIAPPDDKGRCSLGIAVDIVKSAAENASLVIAQVNPQMPRTKGDSYIHAHDIDILVPVDTDLIEVTAPEPSDEVKTIGEYIAALVQDESTVEFGIGAIPQAVASFLKSKKNLGIHTEMFTDTIMELIEDGVVNGSRKTMDKGKVTASFCIGTKKLYEYIDNNDNFAFYPTEYVNDPFIISRQNKQVAINVALEIDLTGQVCSDSIGSEFYSGIGGQVDFNRGAAKSPGGKAIIALPSTARKGEISRIKSRLTPGAGVVTTRGDVHYVVTEYGTAYLHGKSIQERAVALISIAHPDFREKLLKSAIENKLLSKDFANLEQGFIQGSRNFSSTALLDDGTLIRFRTLQPTDEPGMKDLFYALSKQTIYYRFMSNMKHMPRKQIKDLVYINHRQDVAIVATVPESYGDEIIGVGRYYLDEKSNLAEVAFIVKDSWQNKGIGTLLFNQLNSIARSNGIQGFTAEVLHQNKIMQAILNKSNCKITTSTDQNTISYRLEFV